MSYLRFAGPSIDWQSHVEVGIFTAAYDLRDGGTLPDYEYERLVALLDWFSEHLRRPARFARSMRRPWGAICWFRPTAREHLSRAHEMAALLRDHDVLIRMIKTRRVGYVVYEDEHQVVAEPYADTLRRGAA